MLRDRVKSRGALKRLRTDEGGVVSYEYIIVAACIIGAVSAAFGTTATGGLGTALSSAIAVVSAAFTAAV